MRYFTEMTEKTRKPAPELLDDPEVAKAIELLEVINYDEVEQEIYDRYWDAVSVEATWKSIGWRDGEKAGVEKGLVQGRKEGIKQGREEGIEEGMAQGRKEEKRQLARNMLAEGFEPAVVAKITSLTMEEIQKMS